MRFAYADPPYLGQSKRHYGTHADYRGEVDHVNLARKLERDFDGFALSASMKSLNQLLPMFLPDVLVLAWFKTIAPPLGDHRRYSWEPVIMRPVRRYGPGYVPTALIAAPPQFTFRDTPDSHVIGEKPERFCHWMFANAGLVAEDDLVDLFPGSGAVGKAWLTYEAGPTVADGYQTEENTE